MSRQTMERRKHLSSFSFSCLANYQFRISLSNHDGGLLVCQRFKESDREGRERNGTERKGGKEWNGNQVGRNKPRLSRRPCGESRSVVRWLLWSAGCGVLAFARAMHLQLIAIIN